MNRTPPLVSIIVPVYNVEEYLKQSIDSLINQTFKNIEIICINDGSTDNSLSILEEYHNADNRIVIFNQENKGVSASRNKGIKHAKGEYIIFVDPDDWCAPNLVESAYKAIKDKNTDILSYGYLSYEDGNLNNGYTDEFLKTHERECSFSRDELVVLVHCIWDKIYKKDFLLKKKILFPEGIKIAEDGCFNLQCLLHGATWNILNKPLYYYRVNRKNSAMDHSSILIQCEIDALKTFIKYEVYKNSSEHLKLLCIDKFLYGLLNSYNMKRNSKNKLLYIKQLSKFSKDIEDIIPLTLLNKTKGYKKIKKCSLKTIFLHWLFSLKNERKGKYKRKVLTFFGIKVKIKNRGA